MTEWRKYQTMWLTLLRSLDSIAAESALDAKRNRHMTLMEFALPGIICPSIR